MKQLTICGGYGLFLIVSASLTIAALPAIAIDSSFEEPGSVIEEEEITGHRAFPSTEVEAPRFPCPRPGYGPGEYILFPPTLGFRDVWPLLYLSKEEELSFAFPMSEGDWATGDWLGLRHKLVNQGVNIIGSYTTDLLGNVCGGNSRGFAYSDCIDLCLDLDMQKLVKWQGAHLVFSCLDRNGSNLSEKYIGNAFTVAQTWDTQTISYYALWLDQTIFDGWWNIKLGRVATMDDFGASPLYNLYVSGGINCTPLAFEDSGYLSSYPATTWGGLIRFNDKKHNLYAMFGIYQTTNRLYNPAYHGVDFSIRSQDGINLIWEIGWSTEFQPHPLPSTPSERASKKTASDLMQGNWHGMPSNYKFGIYYTPWRHIPQFYPDKNTFYSYGFYWLFDQMVYQAVPGSERGLTLWGAFVYSPQQNTAWFPFQGIVGALYTGLIPRRSWDQLMLALIYGTFSKDYASIQRAKNQGYPTYEMVFEISYRINLSSFFYIQPDIQYIIRPGGTGRISNALVIGTQIGVNF